MDATHASSALVERKVVHGQVDKARSTWDPRTTSPVGPQDHIPCVRRSTNGLTRAQAVRIGWAPQEDLLAEPQSAAASQDGSQPAPLAWTASDGGPPIPGPPVPAWGTPTEGPAAALAEPAVAPGGAATSLPEACLGFPALSLADASQGAGAARGGDPAAIPGQGPSAAGLGAAGGGAAPARFHVFVGNLPGDATDAALLDAFRGLPVLEARVMRDHATGRSKGFGFLGFP